MSATHAVALGAVLLVGCGLAGVLVVIKLRLLFDPTFVSSCNLGGKLDCDAVQTSRYASLLGRPLALFGIGTYSSLLVLTLLARRSRRFGAGFLLVLAACGVATCVLSVYLAGISTFVIGAYCVYCIGLYAVNLLATGILFHALHRLGGVAGAVREAARSPAALAWAAAASALVGAISFAILLPAYATVRKDFKDRRIAVARSQLAEFRTSRGRAYHEVPIDDRDFVSGPENARVTIVEFGDFQCPFCFELYENARPLREKYADRVRWVYKHFPMNSGCNPQVKQLLHESACDAARAASCAGEQGKFWRMHDQLYDNQYELDADDLRRHAAAAGVELGPWDACFALAEPDPITERHTRQAQQAGIVQTPTSYINGHLVAGVLSTELLEYYILAALEHPWDPAPELAPPTAAESMAELRSGDHAFAIDAYEASIGTAGDARSVPGLVPADVSWFEADRACRAAGKRLCDAAEWRVACTGGQRETRGGVGLEGIDRAFPYGYFQQAGICNDREPGRRGEPQPAGSYPYCRTPEGVYDLAGNLAEWTGRDAASAGLVGSHFNSDRNASCLSPPRRKGRAGFRNATTGFRCCADREPDR